MSVAVGAPSLSSRRLPFGLALLALPLLAMPALAARFSDRLGDRVAAALVSALAPINATPPAVDDSLTEAELGSDVFRPVPEARIAAAPAKNKSKRPPRVASVAHGVRVSAEQVLALAQRRAMPTASPVRATPGHPAGLELHGVSALGIGMQDGDVLTEAAGQRAASVATVIGVVLAARSRHSAEISGRFYRAGVPYTVTVEQPYPPGT